MSPPAREFELVVRLTREHRLPFCRIGRHYRRTGKLDVWLRGFSSEIGWCAPASGRMFSPPHRRCGAGPGRWAGWFAILYARAANRAGRTVGRPAPNRHPGLAGVRDKPRKDGAEAARRARQRAEDVKALQARLQALEQKYETTLRLYQSSVALDMPLGPRRVQ